MASLRCGVARAKECHANVHTPMASTEPNSSSHLQRSVRTSLLGAPPTHTIRGRGLSGEEGGRVYACMLAAR